MGSTAMIDEKLEYKQSMDATMPEQKSNSYGQVRPWYSFLTVDVLVRVLSRSIFHPAIVLIFWLCTAAMHKHKKPFAFYTLYYCAFLACIEILIWVNHRITYGQPRKVDWEQEVVVITGGAKGLGRVIVEVLVRQGVKVAVLDVRDPDEDAKEAMEGGGDLMWEVCDVANPVQVEKSAERIAKEASLLDITSIDFTALTICEQLGSPTILINNAATPVVGLPLFPSNDSKRLLSSSQAAQTLKVNAISHFNTISAFLPYLTSASNGGTVITVSSILQHLDPASLSDYASAKAAVSSLHHTLTHEVNKSPHARVRNSLKTVLIETGQIDTDLFSDITTLPWYANFFGPILEAKDVAREIVRILNRGESGIVRMPFYAKCIPWYGVAPGSVQKFVRWFSGIDSSIAGQDPFTRNLQNGTFKTELN